MTSAANKPLDSARTNATTTKERTAAGERTRPALARRLLAHPGFFSAGMPKRARWKRALPGAEEPPRAVVVFTLAALPCPAATLGRGGGSCSRHRGCGWSRSWAAKIEVH